MAKLSRRWAQWTREVSLLAVNGCHFDTSCIWNPVSMPASIFTLDNRRHGQRFKATKGNIGGMMSHCRLKCIPLHLISC